MQDPWSGSQPPLFEIALWLGEQRRIKPEVQMSETAGTVSRYGIRFPLCARRNAMNPNIDFLGICQLLKALRTVGFSETEIKKIARRVAVELGANFTLYA